MITGATDINADSGCGRAIDPDMALRHILGLNITMAQCGSTGHPILYGIGGSLTLKHLVAAGP